MDTTETTRLRALCATIPEGDAVPCCGRAGTEGHRSSWSLGLDGLGALVVARMDGPAQLLVAARTAIPALCDALDARDAEIARVTAHRDQLVADAAATAARSVEEWADVARLVGLDRTALPLDVRRAVEHELAERDAARDALDRVTAERDALLALAPHPSKRTGLRCARCGRDGGADVGDALPVCDVCSDAVTVERDRDDLRAVLETRDAELTLAHERIAELRRAVAAEREACRKLCDAIYTERDDAARRRRTHGSRETRDKDCARLSGQAEGAAHCESAIRARGEGGK